MLSLAQLNDVCMLGKGCHECRYLDSDRHDTTNHICKKKSPDAKIIDEEIAEFLAECKRENENPKKKGVALGDNCAGYLPLKDVVQGYDV